MKLILIFYYVIKHIITNKSEILNKLFYALFFPYNKKRFMVAIFLVIFFFWWMYGDRRK
jgi:hypothetical protein